MLDAVTRSDPMLRLIISCLFFFALLLGLFSTPQFRGQPEDAIRERSHVFFDEPLQSLDDLDKLPFQTFKGLLTTGNSQSKLWLRLIVKPSSEPMVLEILPAYVHEVTVFQRTDGDSWQSRSLGLLHPFSERPLQTFNITVPVEFDTVDQPVLIYVLVRSPTANLGMRVIPLREALQHDAMLGGVMGLTLGLTLIMLMLCLTAWVVTGERLWCYSVLLDLAALQLSAVQFGFAGRYVLPEHPELLAAFYPVSVSLMILAACAFYGRLMRVFGLQGAWLLPYRAGFWMIPVWVFLHFSGRQDIYLLTNNLYLIMMAFWAIPIMFRARHENFWLLLLFRFLLVFSNAMVLFWLLALVLRLPLPEVMAFYAVLPHSLITLFIVLLLLGYNTLLQLREKLTLQAAQQETSRRLAEEQDRFAESTSFLSLILHEVRNPLNHIRLAVGNLLHELPDAGQQKRLGRISASVTLIDDVLQRSLEVDNIDHGLLPIRKAADDVAGLLRQLVEEHPQSTRLHSILPDVLVAEVDADLFMMAVRNLVDNALKYSPTGSAVQLLLASATGGFRVQVRNLPGDAGFPSSERLFRKYYRSDGAMTQSGMGLGLYWVSSVMPRLGGRIEYAAEQGEVVFTLWLPR